MLSNDSFVRPNSQTILILNQKENNSIARQLSGTQNHCRSYCSENSKSYSGNEIALKELLVEVLSSAIHSLIKRFMSTENAANSVNVVEPTDGVITSSNINQPVATNSLNQPVATNSLSQPVSDNSNDFGYGLWAAMDEDEDDDDEDKDDWGIV